MIKDFDLKDKIILVTGASSGIGAQAAVDISEAGSKLILTGRDQEKLDETYNALQGNGHQIIIADLMDEEKIKKLIAEVPQLDGVVHCAGVISHMPAKFISVKEIQKVFSINYIAPTLLTGGLLRKRKINSPGSVVFLSTISTRYPYYGGSLYVSSKSAIEGYSKVLAIEYGKKGIRSNCICPYFVKTPMLDQAKEVISNELLERAEKLHPMGFGETNDVSNAILFLLSDASKWISGENILLGGG